LGNEGEMYIGRDFTAHRNVSEAVAADIDAEIKAILTEARQQAQRIITEERGGLENVVEALLAHEKLDGEQFVKALNGEKLEIETPPEPPKEPPNPPEEPPKEKESEAAAGDGGEKK